MNSLEQSPEVGSERSNTFPLRNLERVQHTRLDDIEANAETSTT